MNVVTKPIFFENGCACALGTFDGVHLGHQSVISAAVKSGYTSVAVVIMQKTRKKQLLLPYHYLHFCPLLLSLQF